LIAKGKIRIVIKAGIIYADEADVLNVAMFGKLNAVMKLNRIAILQMKVLEDYNDR
jgi:hypothetical protein